MTQRAIYVFSAISKNAFLINYSRRMYAIIRKYTPEAEEGLRNECYADLTGLRTFYKQSYSQLAETIALDIEKEIGIVCSFCATTVDEYERNKKITSKSNKTNKHISTYKEMNTLFAGSGYVPIYKRKSTTIKRKIKLTIPFLGKVG